MENSKPIFISYSRIDKNIVFPFVKRIEQELNTTCWIDSEGIESGSQFEEVIVNAIEESNVVLFMLSDSSINSKWTKREVLYAEDERKRIVPVVVDKKGLRKWFKFHFGNVDYIDINDEGQCDKLLNNLASWIGVERMSKKDCYTKTSADIEPKIQISADKSAITLSIHKGLNLTLKRDYERNCFVGEIPVAELLELFYGIKDSAKGAVNGAGVGAGLRPTGMIIGALGKFIKDYYIEEDIKKTKIFNYTINKLNQRYGLHLTKRNSSHSDFTVEVDADRVYGLI
ncbi:toll/interleukin-1 receptor domain-containing protein [Prevotella sp. HCN-7019]|uniref:toll/interleukin-1 receptor domain-containing protein n=1 Tax=Prevotella sp. HCN-7019 TaxID=3134668 RepID=UPI0030C50105